MIRARALLRHYRRCLAHKLYVYQAGRVLGLSRWRLLTHDLSKFGTEARGYAGQFCDGPPEWKALFPEAWHHHWSHNPHHWEFWQDDTPIDMPATYADEMAADWFAASRGYAGAWPTDRASWVWYTIHRRAIPLAPGTAARVEMALDKLFAWRAACDFRTPQI